MKSTIKAVIAGSIILMIGVTFILLAFGLNGWNFNFQDSWEMETYELDNIYLADIDVEFSAGKLSFEFYDGDVIKVEYPKSKRLTTEVSYRAGTLFLATKRPWYNTFLWFSKIPETKVYIPNGRVVDYNIEVNAGTVSLPKGVYGIMKVEVNAGMLTMDDIQCASIEIELNAGAVMIDNIHCATSFKCEVNAGSIDAQGLSTVRTILNVSAGSARLGINGVKSAYTIRTNVSAGSCNVSDQSASSFEFFTLDVIVSAGSAYITFSEE